MQANSRGHSFLLLRLLVCCILSTTGTAALAEPAGQITFVAGAVQLSGQPAVVGASVDEGADLTTGADAYVYVKTVDNGFLILRPNSHARIVAYHIDPQTPANTRVKLELLNGVARSISGQAVKQSRQNFRFNTPVAAIGVRGTDFTVFTDQQTSRVSVLSGGVVVSGFGATCGADGAGPCEGGVSRELFASQTSQLLQVQRGQPMPQLLRSRGLSPDVSAPPRSDEPVAKTPANSGTIALASSEISLDAQKSNGVLAVGKLLATPPPVVVAPIPLPAPAPEVLWGRWQPVANLGADDEALAQLRNGKYLPSTIVNSFFISRVSNSELVLPRDGVASFNLTGSEAYLLMPGKSPLSATIQDPRLTVDFGKREFSTNLTVTAPGNRVDVQAGGDITLTGALVSNLRSPGANATVSGYLGGANAREAGYIFNSLDNPAVGAMGATRWAR